MSSPQFISATSNWCSASVMGLLSWWRFGLATAHGLDVCTTALDGNEVDEYVGSTIDSACDILSAPRTSITSHSHDLTISNSYI